MSSAVGKRSANTVSLMSKQKDGQSGWGAVDGDADIRDEKRQKEGSGTQHWAPGHGCPQITQGAPVPVQSHTECEEGAATISACPPEKQDPGEMSRFSWKIGVVQNRGQERAPSYKTVYEWVAENVSC